MSGMIQRWRERSLNVGESIGWEDHMDAIKSMSVASAESLGHMYVSPSLVVNVFTGSNADLYL